LAAAAQACREAGAVGALVRLLDVCPKLRGLHLVPEALARALRQDGNVAAIAQAVEAGAVPALMGLLQQQPPADEGARQQAVLALASLAHGGGAVVARALAAAGFAAQVVQLMRGADPRVGRRGLQGPRGIVSSRAGGLRAVRRRRALRPCSAAV
jgi:hypothetical protein